MPLEENNTPYCNFRNYAEDISVVHAGCLHTKTNNFVYSHNLTCESGSHLTSVISSQCCGCWSPSPRSVCKPEAGSPCPVHPVPGQLGFCRDDNANLCAEFTECNCPLSQVWELATQVTCGNLVTWLLLLIQYCQVYALNVDVLEVYSTSVILLGAILIPTIAEYGS